MRRRSSRSIGIPRKNSNPAGKRHSPGSDPARRVRRFPDRLRGPERKTLFLHKSHAHHLDRIFNEESLRFRQHDRAGRDGSTGAERDGAAPAQPHRRAEERAHRLDVLVELDSRRAAARRAAAQAAQELAAARLAEVVRGARPEDVEEARAVLEEARSRLLEIQPEFERARSLVEEGIEPA